MEDELHAFEDVLDVSTDAGIIQDAFDGAKEHIRNLCTPRSAIHRFGELAIICALLDAKDDVAQLHRPRVVTMVIGAWGMVLRNS